LVDQLQQQQQQQQKVSEVNTGDRGEVQIDRDGTPAAPTPGSSNTYTKPKVKSDWPELLKVAAEAGQQLISLQSLPFEDRHDVANAVMKLLQEILQVCHVQQRPAVMQMVAHMHSETGMLLLHQNIAEKNSLLHFHKSLQLYRDLSTDTGNHILVQPLTILANALCTMQFFPQAYPLFEEAIRIAEAVLGQRHESLSSHYLNFGIAKVQAGLYAEAEVLLRKAIYIFQINGSGSSHADGHQQEHKQEQAQAQERNEGGERSSASASEAYYRVLTFLDMAQKRVGKL